MAVTSSTNEQTPPWVEDVASVLSLRTPHESFAPLEEIKADKYLGCYLDKDLNFNLHVDEICKKATKLLNLFRRNIHMLPKEVKEKAYNVIVRPHLEYASAAWSPHTLRNIEKVEAVQRRAARFVTGDYNFCNHNHIEQLKWATLRQRRAIKDLVIWF